MSASVNQAILDAAIQHGIFLDRYSTQLQNQIVGFLNTDVLDKLVAEIQKRLANFRARGYDLGPASTNRLALMYANVIDILQGGIQDARGITVDDLTKLSTQEGKFNRDLFDKLTPTAVSWAMPSAAVLKELVTERPFGGALLADWFDKMTADTAGAVQRAIRSGIAIGQTNDQIVQAIRGTQANKYRDGILESTRRSAQALVRTATSNVAHQAREEVYKENENLLDGEQWVATLDLATCPECGALDGEVSPIGEGPRPPEHINCRCTTVPVVKSWQALGIDAKELAPGERSSMDGEVPETTTFGEWIKGKDAASQDEVLGPTRGKMFRAGDLNLGDFLNDRGELMTLDELRTADASLFE